MQLLFGASAPPPKTKASGGFCGAETPYGIRAVLWFLRCYPDATVNTLCSTFYCQTFVVILKTSLQIKEHELAQLRLLYKGLSFISGGNSQGQQQRPRWLVSGPPCSSSLFFQADFLAGCQWALRCHKTTNQFLKKKEKGWGALLPKARRIWWLINLNVLQWNLFIASIL